MMHRISGEGTDSQMGGFSLVHECLNSRILSDVLLLLLYSVFIQLHTQFNTIKLLERHLEM